MSTILSYLAPSFVWTLLKDLWALSRKGKRQLSHADKIKLRTKWKPLFEEEIRKNHQEDLCSDVIIRDVRRVDVYPEIPEGKGISPWFRLSLVSTYHRGIFIAHTWETLTEVADTEEWRFIDYKAGEKGDIRVLLISSIPFDKIEDVDWMGMSITTILTFTAISMPRKHRTRRLRFTPKTSLRCNFRHSILRLQR